MVATQLSLNFSPLPDTLLFIVRKRNYEEIPIISLQVNMKDFYGEIQWVNTSKEFSDEELIDGVNELLDTILDEDWLSLHRHFYSKKFSGFEVLLNRRIEPVVTSAMEVAVVRSWSVPKTDGARVIECTLKPI